MDRDLKPTEIKQSGSIELNLLHYARALPPASLQDAQIQAGTPIYDINGTVLFHRCPLDQKGVPAGYADIAANTVFGSPLIALAPLAIWNDRAILAQGQEALRMRAAETSNKKIIAYDEIRFVAFSYPKIALQFLKGKTEVLMLECFTWVPVPAARDSKRKKLEPANFERWSLLDETPEARKKANHKNFEDRIKAYAKDEFSGARTGLISLQVIPPTVILLKPTRSYEIHYSGRTNDHHVCYELRGQETNVWCVAASTQMLLDFYRYNYPQTRIAQQLGLGTLANPNGLPYARVGDVVTQLHAMSSNALAATMLTNPTFSQFTSELDHNRPMISFIPGHSRTVAGYTEAWLQIILTGSGFRGLLVYDPWPPNAGVITRWENFDTQTYQYAYTAQVTTI